MEDADSLFFVTGNRGKLEEVRSYFGPVMQVDIDLPEIQALAPRAVVEHKLKAASEIGCENVLVEDTSLTVSALNGLPGPFIKWFLECLGLEGLYQMVEATGDMAACACTVAGASFSSGRVVFGEGVVSGRIVKPRGSGFGWDPIFQPDDSEKTFGEMNAGEKKSFSMRYRALEELRNKL